VQLSARPRLTQRWHGRAGPLSIGRKKKQPGRQLTVVTSKMRFLAMKASPIGFLFPWPISVFALLCRRVIGRVGASSLDGRSGFLLLCAISRGRARLYVLGHLCGIDVVGGAIGQAVHRHGGNADVNASGMA
jgi:hypothetical protein